MAGPGPTVDQQADFLVRKLEQTIRDNRTAKGMSLRTWQAIAREEILITLLAIEKRHADADRALRRHLMVVASSLVTIGFWGAVVAADRASGLVAAIIVGVAGAALLFALADWGLGRLLGGEADRLRRRRLASIEDLDRRLRRMEHEMTRKTEWLKEKMDEIVP